MKLLFAFLCIFLTATATYADPKPVENVAGTGIQGFGASGLAASETALSEPFGIVRGPDGLLYFCEFGGHVVRRIEKNGQLTTVAGIPGKAGYTGDGGPATAATLNKPHEIVFDSEGNLYISDMTNHAIRKVAAKTGVMSSVIGNGTKGFAGDGGPAKDALCADPISITIDPQGNLWFCDISNNRLRMIDAKSGKVATVCGNGKKEAMPPGAKLTPETPLNGPRTLAFAKDGTGWLVLREGNAVYTFREPGAELNLVAGVVGKKDKAKPSSEPQPAEKTPLHGPKGISLTADGQVAYLADTESHTIQKIDAKAGTIAVVMGTGSKGNGPLAAGLSCSLARPHGVYVDPDDYLYVGDSENHVVRRLPLP
jgi:streptogramin lyase